MIMAGLAPFLKSFGLFDQASIHRHAENRYVADRFDQSGWVGLTRGAGDTVFKWSDKSELDWEGTWAENGTQTLFILALRLLWVEVVVCFCIFTANKIEMLRI